MARIPDGGIQYADHPDAESDNRLGVERRMLDSVVSGWRGGRSGSLVGQGQPIGIAILVRVVGHGRPGQVHGVQGDDRRLEQAGIGIGVLDLRGI